MLVNKILFISFTLLFAILSFFNSVFFLIPCVLFATGLLALSWLEVTAWEKAEVATLKTRLEAVEGVVKKLSVKTMFG
jgi:uncharacterized membrane protein